MGSSGTVRPLSITQQGKQISSRNSKPKQKFDKRDLVPKASGVVVDGLWKEKLRYKFSHTALDDERWRKSMIRNELVGYDTFT